MERLLDATSCFDGNSDSGDCCCSGASILYGLPSAPRTAAAGASCCRYGYALSGPQLGFGTPKREFEPGS